jgi:hypothetical protein
MRKCALKNSSNAHLMQKNAENAENAEKLQKNAKNSERFYIFSS